MTIPTDITDASTQQLAAFLRWCRHYDVDMIVDLDTACQMLEEPWHYQPEWQQYRDAIVEALR